MALAELTGGVHLKMLEVQKLEITKISSATEFLPSGIPLHKPPQKTPQYQTSTA